MIAMTAAALAMLPAEPFVEKIPGHLAEFRMMPIPAGEVILNGKTHKVGPFHMSETEITWDVFDIYAFRLDMTEEERAANADADSRPSKPYGAPDHGMGHKGYAALSMTRQSAEKFCEWLSAKTGKKYRLPTEAEWQYAAEAGSHKYAPIDDYAWHWDNADDSTQPVGQKKANPWGLKDMLGNVGEWVIPADGKRMIAGGTFEDDAADISPASRKEYTEKWQMRDPQNPKSPWWLSDGWFVGFRVVAAE